MKTNKERQRGKIDSLCEIFGEILYEYIFKSSKWCFVWGTFNLAKVALFHWKLKKK